MLINSYFSFLKVVLYQVRNIHDVHCTRRRLSQMFHPKIQAQQRTA